MQQSYQIVSQNDVERQGGTRDAFITVRRLALHERIARVEVGFAEWRSWFGG